MPLLLQVDASSGFNSCGDSFASQIPPGSRELLSFGAREIASMLIAPGGDEQLLALAYPYLRPPSDGHYRTPSGQDRVTPLGIVTNELFITLYFAERTNEMPYCDTRAGDDSLLLKYQYPHLAVVVTSNTSSCNAPPLSWNSDVSQLTVTLVDTVSARVVYRSVILEGSAPVHVQLLDHRLLVTYWNKKVKADSS